MIKMRINKYLSQLGYASRREVDRLINDGDIKVNNQIVVHGQKVGDEDILVIKGKIFEKPEVNKKIYIMLNKPKGVLSASKDDRGRRTVVDLIDCNERLYPVGRLDYDTEGLIVLTNDGDIFNRIIHPKNEVFKEYVAVIKGEIKDATLSKLAKGVILDDGITLPAKVKIIKRANGKSEIKIFIREGRKRQIRRMFAHVKHPVIDLKREAIGRLNIDNLKIGCYRKLTSEEVKYLKSL